MQLTKENIERYFSIDDIVASGGGRSFFKITEVLEDRIRIQPTESETASRLKFEKLAAVIENINAVNPHKIEASVGEILKKYGLSDTQNESYLFGMAKEYVNRQNRHCGIFVEKEFEKSLEQARKISKEERRAKLDLAEKKPKQISVITTTYKRNPYVVVEVLERANGICEACKCTAPFYKAKDGSPYLEVHHIIQLAHGGDDTVENAIAICPNCHRKMHFGENA